jgi:hypothetical protein
MHNTGLTLTSQSPEPGYEHVGLMHWKEENFEAVARILNILLSALYPSVAIIALYYIRTMTARLGAVLAFSFLFSASLAVLTTAKPVEIFAATAA